MEDGEKPSGQRFSHAYLQRGEPGTDSLRFRVRLAAYFAEVREQVKLDFKGSIHQELGVRIPYGPSYSGFLEECALRDLLDFITVVWRKLDRHGFHSAKKAWVHFVNRAFSEENMGYRADELGGVHYYLDKEFERNLTSTLSALQSPRYSAAVAEVNSAFVALDKTPGDGAAAIRSIFHALEITFKLLCERAGKGSVARLGSSEVTKYLVPIVSGVYESNQTAQSSSKLLAAAFAKWTDPAHLYRHGQKTEEPVQPPIDLAVAMVSTGMTMLRWLAELDQQLVSED